MELLIVAVLVLISVVGVQSFRGRKAEETPQVIEAEVIPEKEPTMVAKASDWMGNQVSGIGNKLGWKKNEELPSQFRNWVANSKEVDKGLKTWISDMPDDGLQGLTEQLAEFCNNLNIELDWLVSEGIEKDPDLKKVISEIVLSYCNACWKAAESQDELEVFKTYLSLIENPTNKANVILSKDIFTELVKQGLTETAPPELFLASDKERQTHMVEAIQKTADENRKAFNQVIRIVLTKQEEDATTEKTEEDQSEPSAPSAPASAPQTATA